MFKAKGLNVILDHHALPGVAASASHPIQLLVHSDDDFVQGGQMFAGNCTSQVEFYDSPDDYNYRRAVTWSVVMAFLSHAHPSFSTVFTIEAVNEVRLRIGLAASLA